MGIHARVLVLTLLAVLLAACQGNKVKPDQQPEKLSQEQAAEQVNDLLDRADKAEPTEKYALMLNAADILARSGDTAWARSIINNLPPNANPLPTQADELAARRALINSYIAAADGFYPLAYDGLNGPELLLSLPRIPTELARAIYRLRAQLLFDMEFYAASLAERIQLGNLLVSGSDDSLQNDDLIWQTLMEIPLDELKKHVDTITEREQQGWFQLAVLSKDNQTNLREQLQQLDQWVLNWPEHPASLALPADLQLLRQLLEEQPQQVAILLPFSGKLSGAGIALRDGFMAAYYEMRRTDTHTPTLRFYNTADIDINALYDQAVLDGAQMIIGPLSKDSILELSLRPEMPVPTLALNTIDNPNGAIPNLYQFGLGVEDEAQLAAQKAWRDGHRRALIIAPNSVWGDRSVDSFAQQWRQLGGDLIKDYRFEDTNDFSKTIKQALLLDESNERAKEIRAIVGTIEFEPRRRQDLDMIFLAAQASQARQVVPTLAFHYAGDVPVYGTSHVYSGQVNKKLDQDMNGVRFSTLPWMFNNTANEKGALQHYGDNNASLQPLYALGVDCYHLYPRLKQLETVTNAHFYGQTGKLSLDEQNQIRRQQIWAEFRGGRARRLADVDE